MPERNQDLTGASTDRVAMSGVQALIRVPLEQKRADQRHGQRSAALISGYPGSPLGGVAGAFNALRGQFRDEFSGECSDKCSDKCRGDHEGDEIVMLPAVNEDLGATSVWGSQLTAMEASATYDGVIGLWFGKAPGLDRSVDALRHANYSGVHPRGGVIVAVGDDPFCKSSSIPNASEATLAALAIPTLYPATVQEVLDFGRLAYELSRYSGAWVALKIHSSVADGYATVDVNPERTVINAVDATSAGPYAAEQLYTMTAPMSLAAEAAAFGPRLDAARAFMAAQSADRIIGADAGDGVDRRAAQFGIVAAGAVYGELRDALTTVGLRSDAEIARAGIRLYKPALIWPLEPTRLAEFADGLDEILVVEEKRAFLEVQIRDLLYGRPNAPRVIGKRGPDREALLPSAGGLIARDIEPVLRARLATVLGGGFSDGFGDEPVALSRPRLTTGSPLSLLPVRGPFTCSGCPHNASTVLPEGSIGHGGIGCHGMVLTMDRQTIGITHMGGEGAQWVGAAPFVADRHRFQNIGDGTLAHSGSLAIRHAVAAGTNVTYKILYNATVAMTGGQDAAGGLSVPALTRELEAHGVGRTVVVTDDPGKFGRAGWPGRPHRPRGFAANASLEHRDHLDRVQRELRELDGVTVLIYDQACAAELRRGRKRGTIAAAPTRIMIDEGICEGCGDCGRESNCASVRPVDTPLGRKTQIDQDSCNNDETCVRGNCPAFVRVKVDPAFTGHRSIPLVPVSVDDLPQPPVTADGNVLSVGIGGTGVVTVNQILATAALLDGKDASGLDQTGLSQKGGAVVSNLRITARADDAGDPDGANDASPVSGRVPDQGADVLLAFDVVTAVANLDRCRREETVAIASTSLVPTGGIVSGRDDQELLDLSTFQTAIDAATNPAANVWIDSIAVTEARSWPAACANLILVGIACQRGLLPVSATSIEAAIEINGAAVAVNLSAFRFGRRVGAGLEPTTSMTSATPTPPSSWPDQLDYLVAELAAYQDGPYAREFLDVVTGVASAERAHGIAESALSEAVARSLFKLMAYKDEYEVARLAIRADLGQQARAQFGAAASISYQLHPPVLKALGLNRKISVPDPVARATFRVLTTGRRLRGTRFDPFGYTTERRTERSLVREYGALVQHLVEHLSPANYAAAVRIAARADQIRGYDSVKRANIERYRAELVSALREGGFDS